MKKKIALLIATFMLAGALTACGGGNEVTPAPQPQPQAQEQEVEEEEQEEEQPQVQAGADTQRLVYGVTAEPQGYDPGIGGETFALPVLINCFYGPFKIDEEGNIVTNLITDWEVSEDNLVYTFYLRENAKFSDGSPLTAHDYVYSYRRVIDPAFASPQAMGMFPIVNGEEIFAGDLPKEELGVVAVSDYVLEITLHEPMLHFYMTMLGSAFYPVKQEAVEAGGDNWHRNADTYIGTGPFMVESFEFGNQVTLVKNPHFYDADNVKLEELVFRVIGDNNTGVTAVMTGEIDGYDAVPSPQVPTLRATSDAFRSVLTLGNHYYMVNKQKEPFNDPRVALALSMAIDREAIIYDVLQAAHTPAFGLIPPGIVLDGRDFRNEIGDYGQLPNAQVEEAQALLAEAGFPNGEGFPVINLRTHANENVRRTIEAFQQMWKTNLNIESEISMTDWQIYREEIIALDYDIAAMGSSMGVPHPTGLLNGFMTGQTTATFAGWSNEDFDNLMRRAWAAETEAEQFDLLVEAEAMIMEHMPIISHHYSSRPYLMSAYVKGFYNTNTNHFIFENAYIDGRGN